MSRGRESQITEGNRSAGVPPAVQRASAPAAEAHEHNVEQDAIATAGETPALRRCGVTRTLGFKDQPLAGPPVHYRAQRRVEPQMPHAAVFFERRCIGQPLPVYESLPGIRIHGEVSDLKCGEVLEEMAALRRCHAEIPEARFHNDAGS